MNIERVILSNLIYSEDYGRKVLPFIKAEYFKNTSEQIVFKLIFDYVEKYNRFPSNAALSIDLQKLNGVNETDFKEAASIIVADAEKAPPDLEWLIDSTEQFCKDRAIYNAVISAFKILEDKDGKSASPREAIPGIMSEALSVSFDSHIGHDFIADAEARFEFYHNQEERIPFDLTYMNKITRGGLPRKTLTILMAPPGIGKSMFMCHFAANNLAQGKNVLYLTLEMQEFLIAQRIDANLLNTPIDELELFTKEQFMARVSAVGNKTQGRLVIKEYPAASVGAAHFRHLLNELRIKKNFIPDIIYIDYLNLCASSRLRRASSNSYEYVKSVAEEVRGLSMEFNLPIVSATQMNRAGFKNSDPDMDNTSESFGLPATCDIMLALIGDETLESLNQIMIKQIKNRYRRISLNRRFVVGVDGDRMRLYDVEQSAQEGVDDTIDQPVMDATDFGTRFGGESFEDFK